jgi:enoyl-CoA hydratase/carnithine racemase
VSEPELVVERHDAVLVVRLNRPQVRNALTWPMLHDIGVAVAAAEHDPMVRAVLLTGTGDRAFCAGEDLRAVAEGHRDDVDIADYLRLLAGQVTIPVVGAANGTAVAGGFELLLGCDMIVASSAARFGLPEVKRGLFAGTGVMDIGRRLPLAIALELALTGDLIDAQRALDLGLVNAVVAPDDVVPAALALTERIVANAPLALSATKELVRSANSGAPDAEARLREWRNVVFTSDDAKEGALAFIEKRAPVWQNR